MPDSLFAKLAGQASLHAMPAKVKQKYLKDMTTEIDRRAQRKYELEVVQKQAIEQGIEQGLQQGLQQAAANFKKLGVSVADIVKATGLCPEEVEKL